MSAWIRALVCAASAIAMLSLTLARVHAAGAIAVGACAAYGYAYDYRDMGKARSAALAKCTGKQCQVVATMQRGCVALAIDGRNACGPHGYAVRARLGLAQNTALQECYKYGGHDCVIRAWACDAKG